MLVQNIDALEFETKYNILYTDNLMDLIRTKYYSNILLP